MSATQVPLELRDRLTISVTEAAKYYGVGRNQAYQACAGGEIPSLRIGNRIVVPVGKMLAQLGFEDARDDEA